MEASGFLPPDLRVVFLPLLIDASLLDSSRFSRLAFCALFGIDSLL